jgi:hypothetical protein
MMSLNSWFSKLGGERHGRVAPGAGLGSGAGPDPEMEHLLRNFRQSVHAWSAAVYQRPRLVEFAPRQRVWRRAAAWALGSVLVVGGVGGGLFEHRHWQEEARIAAAREAEHQRQRQEDRAREAEQELAQVDRDVSREVPSALEPLAGLLTTDESQ